MNFYQDNSYNKSLENYKKIYLSCNSKHLKNRMIFFFFFKMLLKKFYIVVRRFVFNQLTQMIETIMDVWPTYPNIIF